MSCGGKSESVADAVNETFSPSEAVRFVITPSDGGRLASATLTNTTKESLSDGLPLSVARTRMV